MSRATGYTTDMDLPTPRGPLTETLFGALRSGDDFFAVLTALPGADRDDAALALWVLHELHYRDFTGVPTTRSGTPSCSGCAALLERDLEPRLRSRFTRPVGFGFVDDFFDWVAEHDGASIAAHVHRDATREQVLELTPDALDLPPQGGRPDRVGRARLGVRAKAA